MPRDKFSPEQIRKTLKKNIFGKYFLLFLSLLYGMTMQIREYLYKKGVLKSDKINIPVICVGNLSTGGTGKTPAILTLADMLLKNGKKPVILTRGYKREVDKKNSVTIIDKYETINKSECGDEPLMIFHALEGKVPVLVCANRYVSGTVAEYQLGADIAIMDDGFQHLRLKRDADIVLINATSPFTSDHLLPYGNLREAPSALKRATVVIITHCELVNREQINALRSIIKNYTSAPVLESTHKAKAFLNANEEKEYDIDFLKGESVSVISAIGNPGSFVNNLKALGLNIKQCWRYPDHHIYTGYELLSAKNTARGMPIITTLKDYSRFPDNWKDLIGTNVYILKIELTPSPEDSKNLQDLILELSKK